MSCCAMSASLLSYFVNLSFSTLSLVVSLKNAEISNSFSFSIVNEKKTDFLQDGVGVDVDVDVDDDDIKSARFGFHRNNASDFYPKYLARSEFNSDGHLRFGDATPQGKRKKMEKRKRRKNRKVGKSIAGECRAQISAGGIRKWCFHYKRVPCRWIESVLGLSQRVF